MKNMDSQVVQQLYEPTEGEEFLKDFFCSEGIKFVEQKKIENLMGDRYSYRVADFYLPKYKVYVEFFGMWNSSDLKKTEYREKKKVYALNEIPCIYLYPENLGIIHYSFNKRIRAVLKRYNKNRELFKFNLGLFTEAKSGNIFGFLICLALLITFQFDRKAEYYWQWSGAMFAGLIWAGYSLYKGYIDFFKKDYSYVVFTKEF
jgi:hypothetical protein